MKIIIIQAPILSTSGNDTAQEWNGHFNYLQSHSIKIGKREKSTQVKVVTFTVETICILKQLHVCLKTSFNHTITCMTNAT